LGEYHLHESLLALWGCPLAEMVDLGRLSQTCKERHRRTFFVTSAPANVLGHVRSFLLGNIVANVEFVGGVGSYVSGTAIFQRFPEFNRYISLSFLLDLMWKYAGLKIKFEVDECSTGETRLH